VWLVLSAILLHLSVSCTSYVAKKAVVAQESKEEFIWWDSDHSSSPCASASTASPPRRIKFSKEEETSSLPQEKVSLLSESFLLEALPGQSEVKLDPLQASESVDDASAVEVAVPESNIAASSDSAEAEDSCCVSLPCSGWKQIEKLRHRGRDRDSALATDATDAESSTHPASSDPMILALSVGEGDYHAGWMISAMVRLGLMEV
jgi:hypothetical protein